MPPLPTPCPAQRGLGLIRHNLHKCLKNKCLVVGVGNSLRGDDAFGPLAIKQLKGKTSLPLLDAGVAPENLMGPIRRLNPANIIILDAVSTDAPPGSLHWIDPNDLDQISVSTHASSLDLLFSYLKNDNPKVKMYILGAVPTRIGLGESISEPIDQALNEIVALFNELAPPTSENTD